MGETRMLGFEMRSGDLMTGRDVRNQAAEGERVERVKVKS